MVVTKRIIEPNLFAILIQPNSVHCGIQLGEISLPERCAVLGILRNEQVISAEVNPVISANDYILAIAIHPMMTPALKVALKKVHLIHYYLCDCLLKSKSEISHSCSGSVT